MTLQTWMLFCATEAVLCVTPGPAVLFVVSVALTRGARSGLGGSLGILAANAGYFVLSATSLGAVLLYVIACACARSWADNPRLGAGLQRVGGVLLVGAAGRLVAIRNL